MNLTNSIPLVLLVEDEPDDAELTRRALAQAGLPCDLVLAEDGVAAREHLFGQGRDSAGDGQRLPALVLLDLNMPRISGFQLLGQIRATDRTRHLPVIVLSSSRELRDVTASYQLGCNAYVRKELDFEQFSHAMRLLVQFWLGVNISPHQVR